MADMEGVEQTGEVKEEQGEGEDSGQQVSEISLEINEDIAVPQPELCVIYACVHWVWKSENTRWNNIEIKEIVGHAMLELNDYEYFRLKVDYAIESFRDPDHVNTLKIKGPAEESKDRWIDYASQMRAKYERGWVPKRYLVTNCQLITRPDWLSSEMRNESLSKAVSERPVRHDLRKDAAFNLRLLQK